MGKFSHVLLSATLLVSCVSHLVNGYGGGAHPSVCDSMVPSHGAQAQTSESPYKITLSRTGLQGFETVNITLSPKNPNDIFKGFLIQVRKPGGDTAVGEFSQEVADPNAKPLKCFDRARSAMTHNSPVEKKSVTVEWMAPNDADAEYQVFYSVVGTSSQTFWSSIPHPEKLRVTRNAQATTTAAAIKAATPRQLEIWREIYGGCGETKGCFGMPGNCVEGYDENSADPTVCTMIVTWSNEGGKNMYQLSGTYGTGTSGYVAVGMSSDDKMGADSVVGCAYDGTGVTAKRYHNPSTYNEIHSDDKLGLKQVITEANVDGHLYCHFEQENHPLPTININFDNDYHYLLSRANSLRADALPQHEADDKVASPEAVHISDNVIMGASNNKWLVQLHGGLMVIAWLLCASTGMFTARYFKHTHTDFTPAGKAFWFALHVFCMCSTAFLTICGAIFIIIRKKGFEIKDWHPALGCVVIGLAICQVVIALFRPHPGTKWRPIFNWVHWGVGNSAHIIGIACIFLAWDLSLADLKRFDEELLWMWITMATVLFHVLMHIVMSIHTLWADSQVDTNNKKRAMFPGPMKPNGQSAEAPGTAFRTFMLSLYLIVMGAGAIALVALVFWPKKTEPTS